MSAALRVAPRRGRITLNLKADEKLDTEMEFDTPLIGRRCWIEQNGIEMLIMSTTQSNFP